MAMANTAVADESCSTSTKRQKQEQQPLIPGLPDHIAQLCLSPIHPSLLFSISHSWRRLIYSPSFPPFFSLYAILKSHSIQFHNFDPISNTWRLLSPPPLHHLLLRHPSFLSRNLSVQSISVAGHLVLLAATTHNLSPALSRPLVFHPLSRTWSFGPSLSAPRRWCALGALRGTVYVASGIGTHFSIHVARSLEKWDLLGPNGAVWRGRPTSRTGGSAGKPSTPSAGGGNSAW
ncbi:F-box/kelch-repeat protein SKIP25 [Spatholobus suberectus]|nr:F-box/kelch-repeat protein SKIP25 [Spatholobus suberectus]